jgi:hypothetical protein
LDMAAAETVEKVAGALDGRSLLPVGHGGILVGNWVIG